MGYLGNILLFVSPFLYQALFRKDVSVIPPQPRFVLRLSFLLIFLALYFWFLQVWSSDSQDLVHTWIHLPLILGFVCDLLLSREKLSNLFSWRQFRPEDLFIYGFAGLYFLLFIFFLRVRFSADILMALLSLFLMAVAQEFYFRGAVQRLLQFKIGTWNGLICANILFVTYHFTPMQLFGEASLDTTSLLRWFISGLVFGYLYHRSNNLIAIAILHFSYNAMAFALNMKVQ